MVFNRQRYSRRGRGLALVLVAALVSVGCAPTIHVLKRTDHVARVRVESTPPGGTVVVNDTPVGTTPTTVPLRYTVFEEEVVSNDQRWGGVGGILLSAATAATSVLFFAVGGLLNDVDADVGSGIYYGYGVGLAISSLVSLGVSIWAISTAAKRRTRVEPSYLDLALQSAAAPGLNRVRVVGSGSPPPFDALKLLRFDAASRSWLAPGKPAGIGLKMRSRRRVVVTPRRSISEPRRPSLPPPESGQMEEPGIEIPTAP